MLLSHGWKALEPTSRKVQNSSAAIHKWHVLTKEPQTLLSTRTLETGQEEVPPPFTLQFSLANPSAGSPMSQTQASYSQQTCCLRGGFISLDMTF